MSHRNYDDLMNISYPFPLVHKRMSQGNRAAQFAPFAALTGYEDQVNESARFTDAKLLLGEDQITHINEQLVNIAEHISTCPKVEITYFQPDSKKQGGSYHTLTGHIKRIDDVEHKIILTDRFIIPINNLLDILMLDDSTQ